MIKVKPPPFFDYDINDHHQGILNILLRKGSEMNQTGNTRGAHYSDSLNQQLFEQWARNFLSYFLPHKNKNCLYIRIHTHRGAPSDSQVFVASLSHGLAACPFMTSRHQFVYFIYFFFSNAKSLKTRNNAHSTIAHKKNKMRLISFFVSFEYILARLTSVGKVAPPLRDFCYVYDHDYLNF